MRKVIMLFFLFVSSSVFYAAFGQNSLKKANKLYDLFDFQEAIPNYEKALEKDPENVDALSRLADCYRIVNKMDRAAEYYERALARPGIDPIHLFNYGKVLKALGRYERARQWFLNYAEAYPGFGNNFAESCNFALAMQGTVSPYEVRNEYINSEYSDFAPAFSPNGRIAFASARTDLPRTGDRKRIKINEGEDNQLFLSEMESNGFLSKPGFLHPEYRHDKNEGPIAYSSDGRLVAFTKNNFKNGNRQIPAAGLQLSIYTAAVDARGNWAAAKPFPYNGDGYSTGYPCFADNGSTIYFASDRPDGYGGFDIFVSKRVGETWSIPTNLGPVVNSPGHEITPFYDGNELFFASDWHPGLGGFDIFRAVYEGGDWSKISNLGNEVNTPVDDYGFIYSPSSNTGYFVSNRPGGKGLEDLYRFTKKTENIQIVVFDALNRSPIPGAVVDFSACGESLFTTDDRGAYGFKAILGLDCEVTIRKLGYDEYTFLLTGENQTEGKRFEVFLEKLENQYIGRVVNSLTNDGIENATVRIADQKTGQKFETTTGVNGEFQLAMAPYTSYLVTYSKAGYVDARDRINTGSGKDKTLLGTVKMRLSSLVIGDDEVDTGKDPGDDANETPPIVNITEGYSIQVAAIAKSKASSLSLSKYQQLSEIGNVYTTEEGSYVKIRVGIYPEKKDAESARKDVSAKGFRSFLVKEKVDSKLAGLVIGGTSSTGTVKDEVKKDKKDEVITTLPFPKEDPPATSDYKVQLAAYSNPAYFKRSKVEDLGDIEQRKRGNLTIMLLSGFASKSEAETARKKAQSAGFKGAYLVRDLNGKLERVR